MRIVFLSETDQCRGPMARAIAERMAKQEHCDTAVFDSAALDTQGGETPDVDAVTFLRGEKINIAAHRSKPLTLPLIDSADVIFAFTRDLTKRGKEFVGPEYAPKVVLFLDGIDLASKTMDIERPTGTVQAHRRVYAALSAAMGRLIRTLEEPGCTPEYFGSKTMPKKVKFGATGDGPRAGATTIDPEKRLFVANFIFDQLERAFEPPTTAVLREAVVGSGHNLSALEVDEILKQDLHNFVRLDRDGAWHVIPGADQKRREEAKAQARARSQADKARQEQARQKTERDDDRITESGAYEVLGLRQTDDYEEAQKKYRALLKRYHPDKFHDDDEFRDMAEQKARRINAAWLLLKDKFLPGDAEPQPEIV